MAYEPKTWQCGEVVTADDLNRIEQGIANAGGGALIVKGTHHPCPEGKEGNGIETLDHTWQEMKDAYDAGMPIFLCIELVEDDTFSADSFPLGSIGSLPSVPEYSVGFNFGNVPATYTTDSENGYPSNDMCEDK